MDYYEERRIPRMELASLGTKVTVGIFLAYVAGWLAWKYIPSWLLWTSLGVLCVGLIACWGFSLCIIAKRADQRSEDLWRDHWTQKHQS